LVPVPLDFFTCPILFRLNRFKFFKERLCH
jgi:hypothetical protein